MKYRNAERYHTRRLVEIELSNYKDTKKEYEEKRESVLYGSSFQEICIQSGTASNPTQNKALSLCDLEMIETDRKLKAIELGVRELRGAEDKDFYNIINLKYFEKRLTDLGIQIELSMSERNYWRRHCQAISIIASFMGWKI